MLITFVIYNMIILPLAWFKGFYVIRSLILPKRFFLNMGIWLLFGAFIILAVIMKDTWNVLKVMLGSLRNRKN